MVIFTHVNPKPRIMQIVVLVILLAGAVTGVYLSQNRTSLEQKAAVSQTEYGFGNSFYASYEDSYRDLANFKVNVVELVLNNQKWVRFGIAEWEIIQDCNNNTRIITWDYEDLEKYDQAIDFAKERDLKIVLVNPASPTNVWWLRCRPSAPLPDLQAMSDIYYRFLAERYKGKIDVWQVGNENDIGSFRDGSSICLTSTFSGCQEPPPNYLSDWNALLGTARNTLKSVDSNNIVTTNAGVFSGNFYDGWVEYFTPLNSNLDILSLDIYPTDNESIINSLTNWVNQLKQHFGKNVMIMETGLCTSYWGEDKQETYVPRYIQNLSAANPLAIITYEYQDYDIGDPCLNSFGIKERNGRRKAGYDDIIFAMQNPNAPTNTPRPPTRTPTPSPTPTPTPTPTITPTVTISPTPTPSPTLPPSGTPTATPTNTPAPTNTPIPTATPQPTPTISASGTKIALTLFLQGISETTDNRNPQHPQRTVEISVINVNEVEVANTNGFVNFDAQTASFSGTIDLGSVPTGVYSIKVKTERYLRKLVGNIIGLTAQNTTTLALTSLITGDVNGDNKLDIQDYNQIASCFGTKKTSASCLFPDTADLDDDTDIDGIDYNYLIRNLSVSEGD